MLSIPKQSNALLLTAALSLIATLAPSTPAQTSTRPLEFEVATIKPVDPHASSIITGTDVYPDGIVKLNGLPLRTMIQEAFNLNYWQVTGVQPWMDKNLYNVVGEPPDSIRQSQPDTRHTWYTIDDPRLREMLQTLLIQRFHLTFHRTTQTGKVYFLVRTSKPLALHPTKPVAADSSAPQSTSASIGWAEGWMLSDTTMPELANFAGSYVLHRPVLDHTGLTAAFDYRSAPEESNSSLIDQETSFLNLLKEVGLKLQSSTGQEEILTIDHAEPPSPN